MSIETDWYLGPFGALRALPRPNAEIPGGPVRYGGNHQALSGARTVDVTGFRSDYSLEWSLLERADWEFLEALHLRHMPGPFGLLVPGRRNRLTPQSSTLSESLTGYGVWTGAHTVAREWSYPAAAGPGVWSIQLVAPSGVNWQPVRFDPKRPAPVIPGETLTGSVWLKADHAQTVSLAIDRLDRFGNRVDNQDQWADAAVTTEWQRFTITRTAEATAAGATFALLTNDPQPMVSVAAPQLESGDTATAFEQGGAALWVAVDQLTTTRQLLAYTDVSVSLLEV